MEDEFESSSEVERMIEELKQANIGFDNYRHFVGKLKSTERVIKAQIENSIREYKSLKGKHDSKTNEPSYKRASEEGFIPKEVYELSEDMNGILKASYSWKLLENQMYTIVFDKIFSVLDDAKALDIKRDALKEMREMEKERNNLLLSIMNNNNKMLEDVLNNKISAMDEKFIAAIDMLLKQSNHEKKKMLSSFGESINKFFELKESFIEAYKREKPINTEEQMKTITKRVERVDIADKKKPKKEDDIIEVDDNPFADSSNDDDFDVED